MLKIKESVDLKELEKFGFLVFNDNKQALYEAKNKYCDTCWFYAYKNNKVAIGIRKDSNYAIPVEYVLDKLQELKGSDKE